MFLARSPVLGPPGFLAGRLRLLTGTLMAFTYFPFWCPRSRRGASSPAPRVRTASILGGRRQPLFRTRRKSRCSVVPDLPPPLARLPLPFPDLPAPAPTRVRGAVCASAWDPVCASAWDPGYCRQHAARTGPAPHPPPSVRARGRGPFPDRPLRARTSGPGWFVVVWVPSLQFPWLTPSSPNTNAQTSVRGPRAAGGGRAFSPVSAGSVRVSAAAAPRLL